MIDNRQMGIRFECVSEGNAYNADREKVRELRMRGEECRAIAEQTGIPEGQVIVYCLQLGLPASGSCRRIQLSPEDEAWLRYRQGEPKGRTCPVCGGTLTQPYIGRRKRFCSDRCKNKWWNDKRKTEMAGRGRKAICENCGKDFIAMNEKNGERRYCSRTCYFESRYGIRGERDE